MLTKIKNFCKASVIKLTEKTISYESPYEQVGDKYRERWNDSKEENMHIDVGGGKGGS